jgi:hypothetical protein
MHLLSLYLLHLHTVERSKAIVYGRSLAGIAGSNLSPESAVCVSVRDLCDGPIPHPEESYRLWCVIVCDVDTSSMRRPWPALGCCARNKQNTL